MLRGRGTEFLEQDDDGPIEVDGAYYSPRRLVTQRRVPDLANDANRRVLHLLRAMSSLCAELLSASMGSNAESTTRGWARRINSVLAIEGMREIARAMPTDGAGRVGPSTIETTDIRYRTTFALSRSIARDFGWSASLHPVDRYAFVQYSDLIYQAYVASLLAEELGLRPTDHVLGRKQPAFVGDTWSLYYDTVPPLSVLRTWRSHTATPDRLKPDMLLVNRLDGRVILGDSKYRNDGLDAAESARREMESYLSAFGLSAAFMAFPTEPGQPLRTTTMSHAGKTLVEVSIQPDATVSAFIRAVVPTLLALAEPPRY